MNILGKALFITMTIGLCVTPSTVSMAQHLSQEPNFYRYYAKWSKTLQTGSTKEIAQLLNFPFIIYGHPYGKQDFLNDHTSRINVFSKSIIKSLIFIPTDEIQSYRGLEEFNSNVGGCPNLPKKEPIYEIDVEAEHGGPAMLLIFSKNSDGYALYCITRM